MGNVDARFILTPSQRRTLLAVGSFMGRSVRNENGSGIHGGSLNALERLGLTERSEHGFRRSLAGEYLAAALASPTPAAPKEGR